MGIGMFTGGTEFSPTAKCVHHGSLLAFSKEETLGGKLCFLPPPRSQFVSKPCHLKTAENPTPLHQLPSSAKPRPRRWPRQSTTIWQPAGPVQQKACDSAARKQARTRTNMTSQATKLVHCSHKLGCSRVGKLSTSGAGRGVGIWRALRLLRQILVNRKKEAFLSSLKMAKLLVPTCKRR